MHDDELMARVAEGEETAFRLLVERWEKPVHAFLWRMTGSTDDAMDLTQDTFIKVHGSAAHYEVEGKFRSWLFRIAGNLVRSWARRRKVISWISFDVSLHDRVGTTQGADTEIVKDEIKTQVRQAIASLPERQRQALILQRYHDLSQLEVAEVMETTEAAVESLLQRALKSLRGKLATLAEG